MSTPNQPADLMKMFDAPTEDTLGAAERALVEAGRVAFRELEKLLKNIGLYGADHQGTDRFRALFRDAIRAFVEARPEGVALAVGPYEFTIHDQPVYQNTNPDKNFVYKFFQDGVRRLTFEPGISDAELAGFTNILLTNWEDPALFEDDTVTLMWAQDFQHLHYQVVESFEEEGDEGSDHTVAAVVTRVKTAAPPATLDRVVAARSSTGPLPGISGASGGSSLGGPGAGAGSGGGGRLAPPGALRASLHDSLLSVDDLARFEESPFAMDEHDFERLRGVVLSAGAGTLEKFIEILFKVGLVSQAALHERVFVTFERITDTLLEGGRLDDLARVFARVRGLVGPEGELLFENVEEIDRVFDRVGTPARVARILEVFVRGDAVQVEGVLRLLRLLNPSASMHIVRGLSAVTQPERRAALLELLPETIPPYLKDLARVLQTCDGALAHELMRVLRGLDHPDVTTAVHAALNNPDAAVRLEALGALPTEKLGVYLPSILNALKDKSKTLRTKALNLLVRMPTPQVHAHLLQRVKDKDFAQVDLDEKRRYFVAVSLTGNANPWLMELLEGRSLLQKKAEEEQRACAAIGLALRMHAPAVPVFEREVARSYQSDVVREACTWAIQHVRQPRDVRTRQLYDVLFRGTL
jgi:hypothetical protein